ncbi:MAG: Glycerol-3-phosphate acyltransferase [Thermoanaerobacterales bacterium 50_218]|nr:MAG: Glycerol-3-phosphate acyltransferase [Thermoanaerobacterales bacterium 50_218]HAA89494.1 acyl-phosphate glycerol 3-phosphate acyltransferase [Peptococcaceae bacterium]
MGFLLLLASYLVGSIPFGFLFGKLKGVDLRERGSGNIGATNAFRVLGRKLGVVVFLCDFLKGMIPALLGKLWGGPGWGAAAGIAAVVGHNWSVFLGFRGGRGVSTSAGVLVALTPKVILAALGTWLGVLLLTGYVSLSSITAALLAPVYAFLLRESPIYYFFIIPASLFIFLRHLPNIRRLLRGIEPRVRFW